LVEMYLKCTDMLKMKTNKLGNITNKKTLQILIRYGQS